MTPLERSIIKTLAYYETLGQYPLTSLEIYQSLQKENDGQVLPSFYDVLRLLATSKTLKEKIKSKNGIFFLKGNAGFYDQRITRQKTAIKKWRKVRRIATYLALTPFLRGLMVSGSLAFSNTKPESDLDFMVFTEKDRIWTCRTFLSLLLQIIGQRRHGDVVQDKVCLNHYLAQPDFPISLKNLSNAQLYSHLIPLTNCQNYQVFQQKNPWLAKIIFSYPISRTSHLRTISQANLIYKIGESLAHVMETILTGWLGNSLEKALASWQTLRIRKKTSHRQLQDEQLCLNSQVLLFHYPICRNREVMGKYEQKLATLSI